MDSKLKHLEFIQGVINRMAFNSFLLKGWSLTITAAIFALATKDGSTRLISIAYLPVIVFWFLDSYFLRQERLYRKLYDSVRVKNPNEIDFSMDTKPFQKEKEVSYFSVLFSITLRWFHGIMLVSVIVANIIIWKN
jgi:hypothetical protein